MTALRAHMSPRMFTVAVLAAATLPAATAAAAPDRTAPAPLAADGDKYEWTTAEKSGVVFTSTVASKAPVACSPLFSCDATLIRIGDHDTPLDLQVNIAGDGTDIGG